MSFIRKIVILLIPFAPLASAAPSWSVAKDGGIVWEIKSTELPVGDHLEQSGKSIDAITNWNIDATGHLKLTRSVRWPMLRTLPDNTHAALQVGLDTTTEPTVKINGSEAPTAVVSRVSINGILTFHGTQG